jgi:ATP-binding cassette, subfamily B, bacterial
MTFFVTLGRWRPFLVLFWRATRWQGLLFGLAVLVLGLVPSAIALSTGALVGAIPAAVDQGLSGAAGRSAWVALGILVGCLATAALARMLMSPLIRIVDSLYQVEVHRTLARVTLGTPGIACLDDPSVADKLQAVQIAEERGVLGQTARSLAFVATMRISGIAALTILLAFEWWAPLLLGGAWQLVNLVFLKIVERGFRIDLTETARQRRAQYLRSLAMESSAAKEVRVFGLGDWMVERYTDAWTTALRSLWQTRSSQPALTAAATVALLSSHAIVLGALAMAVDRGEVTAAGLVIFVQAVIATHTLGLIADAQWWLAQSLALTERIVTLDARTGGEPVPSSAAPSGSADRRPIAVRLENVSFTYPGRDRPTLNGLSLEVPAGQSLAIVGVNGAGKSTLIKLLCGFYEPDAGAITLNGAAPARSRSRIGVIFQDFVRYKLPLRENVGFGHLSLLGDDDALEAALNDASGRELLARLPKRWETVLSREFTDGVDLSGGEWQRVALARALVAVRGGAGLLILDEPTASLDVRAETELFERFLDLTRSVTTILVSHRLSSVRHADRIVVLDDGRIVEGGTHHELMGAAGRYAALFSLQGERFATAPRPNEGDEMGMVAHA